MNKYYLLLSICLMQCSVFNKEKVKFSDSEIWKLGWRMIESNMDEKLEVADLQFDSLLNLDVKINKKFLMTGLETKARLLKDTQIIEILKSQDVEMLKKICTNKYLNKFEKCVSLSEERIERKELQLELIKMFINDQYVRSNLQQDLLNKYGLTKAEVIKDTFGVETDERNRNMLKNLINKNGFPTRKWVGKDGMDAVFFIIQHADEDKEWQKNQLSNIEKSVKNGDMEGERFAYLYDRIKINSGEKQLYGTQFSNVDPKNNIAVLGDTEDLENLDKRRMEIDLMPIDMYKRFMLKSSK